MEYLLAVYRDPIIAFRTYSPFKRVLSVCSRQVNHINFWSRTRERNYVYLVHSHVCYVFCELPVPFACCIALGFVATSIEVCFGSIQPTLFHSFNIFLCCFNFKYFICIFASMNRIHKNQPMKSEKLIQNPLCPKHMHFI